MLFNKNDFKHKSEIIFNFHYTKQRLYKTVFDVTEKAVNEKHYVTKNRYVTLTHARSVVAGHQPGKSAQARVEDSSPDAPPRLSHHPLPATPAALPRLLPLREVPHQRHV